MSKREFHISQWHNVSTNSSLLKMEGVKYQDLKSIILNLYKHKSVVNYKDRIDRLYEHLSDFENPHDVRIEQFNFGMVDVLYEKWLQEGYKGTKEDLLKVLFRYLEYARLEDFKKDDLSIEKITSVKVVSDLIKEHGRDLGSHRKLLGEIWKGEVPKTQPYLSLMRYVGVSDEIDEKYNGEIYKEVDLKEIQNSTIGDTFSVCMKVRYKDKVYLKMDGGEDSTGIEFSVSRTYRRVKVKWVGLKDRALYIKSRRDFDKKIDLRERLIIAGNKKRLMKVKNIKEGIDVVKSRLGSKERIDENRFRRMIGGDVELVEKFFGFKGTTDTFIGEGIFYDNEVEYEKDEYFGFLFGTRNVIGEKPFYTLIEDPKYPVDENDELDVFFGFWNGTRNVFGEAPFYTLIDTEEPVDPEPVYPGDGEGEYSLDIRGIGDSEWLTIVFSIKENKIRIFVEGIEERFSIPVVRVVGEKELMTYKIVPDQCKLDIEGLGLKNNKLMSTDSKVLEIYREWFNDNELEYIFNLYR